MTREEAIAILENEKECVNRANKNDYCNRDCYNCELVKTDTEILTALDMAISALSAEPCREADDYENEIADLHNRLDIAEYDKERYKEEITTLEAENKGEWIPVTERLPKIADVYRVTRYYPNNVMNPKYLVDACCFDGSNTWYNDNRINHERAYANNVIAWQENPEPYKPERGE